ncbi:MAG: ParB/RepB/Spo0J family partition protein [Bacillota bacterium]
MLGKAFGRAAKRDGEQVAELPIDSILFNPFQPRKSGLDEGLEELAASIVQHGLLQPVVVRRVGGGYELVAGERRLRACKRLGMKSIPAIIREGNDRDSALLALVENLQRQDLCVLDEAEGYRRLMTEFRLTQEEVARQVGKSQPTVANKLRLLRLPEPVKKAIINGDISERHARALLRLEDPEEQVRVLGEILETGLNVQQTDDMIAGLVAPPGDEPAPAARKQRIQVFKDLRIFKNSIRQVVMALNRTGVRAIMEEEDSGDHIRISVLIVKPKDTSGQERAV